MSAVASRKPAVEAAPSARAGALDVVVVGSYPPPHGGQSVHIENLSRYLRLRGMRVRVYNTGTNKQIAEDGVVNISSARSLLSALLGEAPIGVVHVHVATPEDYGKLAPVALAAIVRGFRWVVTLHSGASGRTLRTASPMRRLASRVLLGRADRIICVNEAMQQEVSKVVRPGAAVVVTPFSLTYAGAGLGSEVDAFLRDHAPVITCVGFHDALYGLEDAVRLMPLVRQQHPRAGLLLVGETRGSEPCRALIAQLGLANDVLLCGNQGHQECLTVFSRSALFLRPTRYDGDSLSVREALALGTPVVASATDFRPAGVTLFETGNFEDLTEKTLRVLAAGAGRPAGGAQDDGSLDRIRQLYLDVM